MNARGAVSGLVRRSAPGASRPTDHGHLVDAGFVAVLTLLGLGGYGRVYSGTTYLAVGAFGILLGVVVAHAGLRARLAGPAVVAAVVVTAILFGAVPLRDGAVAGFLPSWGIAESLAHVMVYGWKQLLTTVRPIGEGDLLALPYLLGLVAAVSSYSLARRTRPVAAPLAPPVAVVALSILFGRDEPAGAVLQGGVFTVIALAWVGARRSRQRLVLVRGSRRAFRVGAATVMLATSFGTAAVAGPGLPFATSRERVVLRAEPPVDLSMYPSPLSGFRRFTKAVPEQQSVAEKTLFTVRGSGADEVVRLATLDHYDGKVWGAANRAVSAKSIAGFARVGGQVRGTSGGPTRDVTIAIGDGYQDVWLPSVGRVRAIGFAGPRQAEIARSLRYNAATRTGVVPGGFRPGDVVEVSTGAGPRLSDEQLKAAEPEGAPLLDPASYEFVGAAATKLSGGEQAPMARVMQIATGLRAGAYTHGKDHVVSDPGHGMGRIATFLQARELVGDDEQYGSAMALMANAVGVPARVVLTARPRADGVVLGEDVQVSVELALAGRGWVLLHTDRFTPPRTNKPKKQPKEVLPKVRPKVVPPPMRPPLAGSFSSSEAEATTDRDRAKKGGFSLPVPLVVAVKWAGPPIALLVVAAGVILLLKAERRRRRRTRGSATRRVAMGWTEVLDVARDLGVAVTSSGTRREQARALEPLPVVPLAVAADAIVFGPDEPSPADVDTYWTNVADVRAALTRDLSRWRRLRVSLSLRSLVPALTRTPLGRAGAVS